MGLIKKKIQAVPTIGERVQAATAAASEARFAFEKAAEALEGSAAELRTAAADARAQAQAVTDDAEERARAITEVARERAANLYALAFEAEVAEERDADSAAKIRELVGA